MNKLVLLFFAFSFVAVSAQVNDCNVSLSDSILTVNGVAIHMQKVSQYNDLRVIGRKEVKQVKGVRKLSKDKHELVLSLQEGLVSFHFSSYRELKGLKKELRKLDGRKKYRNSEHVSLNFDHYQELNLKINNVSVESVGDLEKCFEDEIWERKGVIERINDDGDKELDLMINSSIYSYEVLTTNGEITFINIYLNRELNIKAVNIN